MEDFSKFLAGVRTADTNNLVGVRGEVEIDSSSSITLTNARAVQAIIDVDNTTPTVTNSYLVIGGYEGDTSNITNKYGIYLLGSDNINRLDGVTLFQGGTESAPSIARLGSTNTGIYFPGSNTIGITTGGSDAITIANNNVTFAGSVTAPSATINGALTIDTDSTGKIQLNSTSQDDWQIDIDSNGFVVYNSTDSRYDLKISGTGAATFAGTLGIAGSSPVSTSALTIKSQSASSQQSAIDIIQNGGTNAIIRMGEKSTDGGRLHMFDGGTEKLLSIQMVQLIIFQQGI